MGDERSRGKWEPLWRRRQRAVVSVRRAVVYELLITGLLFALAHWAPLDASFVVVMWAGTMVGFAGAVHDRLREDRQREAGRPVA
jgi:hypothetical protein